MSYSITRKSEPYEGAAGEVTTYVYTITREDADQAETLRWAVAPTDPARANNRNAGADDFAGGVFPSGSVAFAPGQVSRDISFQVAGDDVDEFWGEIFNVGIVGSTTYIQGTILDDDDAPEERSDTSPLLHVNSSVLTWVSTTDQDTYRMLLEGGKAYTLSSRKAEGLDTNFGWVRVTDAWGSSIGSTFDNEGAMTFTPSKSGSYFVTMGNYYNHGGYELTLVHAGTRVSASSVTLDAATRDLLLLGDADITAVGNALDNTIIGNGGNNVIDGAGGYDTVVFRGALADYAVARMGAGYTIRSLQADDGNDQVVNVEALRFADKTVNLTVQAQAAAAPQADVTRLAELYVAFFNRVPDADGISYWIGQMQAGQGLEAIADAFYYAGVQYADLTGYSGRMSDADFVKVVYANVLGRTGDTAPPQADIDYWTDRLASGGDSRGSLVNTMLDSAHSFQGDATWGWVADLLANKIAVARTFAIDWGLNFNTSSESISQGMAIAAAVTPESIAEAVGLIGVVPADLLLA